MLRTVALAAVCLLSFAASPRAQANAGTSMKKPSPPAAAAANGNVRLADLPPAVRATVEKEAAGATLKGVSKERENGQTVYELETLVRGRTRDLMIDAAGKVYVVEEQLDVHQAPAAVRTALEARGTIVRLESVMENGRTHYEGQVRPKGGKSFALELDADGKPVKK